MLKLLSWTLIMVGVVTLAFGGYQWWSSAYKEQERLSEAQTLFSTENQKRKDTSIEDVLDRGYEKGETIGLLYIPKLDREIPIVEGTDEEELAQGVGHYHDTGLPGQNKQILLSGHRDTVFRNFDQLAHGDEFHVKMEYGTYRYKIRDHEIVAADNTTVIDPSREDEYLTVSTCYPFSMIGNAPDRYVLYAYPQ
ncbi:MULTISPECIES: class D sortase [Gracilibacillus]|uniref:class D sortase n=1 Tax=Gracilibacillus TaxID=74385 RepID=UPI00082632E3|nr:MULTISPECIES: class D sortase [Gracilibacillus]